MGVNEGNEKRSFEEVIKYDLKQLENFSDSYSTKSDDYFKNVVENSFVARSFYAEQLKIWFDIFDKKRIHITTTENLASKPQKTFSEIFKFLEISDYKIPKPENKRQGVYSPMNKEIRMKLSSFFKPFNDDLYELLETKFNWNDEL